MTKLNKETAMAAIRVLAGKRYIDFSDQKDAVEELIDETRAADQSSVSTETVVLLLNRADAEKSCEALTLAIRIAMTYRPEAGVAQQLIKTAARFGFYAKFPELTIKLLNRQPSNDEIIQLVSSYVDNIRPPCASTEERLKFLTTAFVSKQEARVQLQRIENRG